MTKNIIIATVEGGNVEVIRRTEGSELVLIDWDNFDAETQSGQVSLLLDVVRHIPAGDGIRELILTALDILERNTDWVLTN